MAISLRLSVLAVGSTGINVSSTDRDAERNAIAANGLGEKAPCSLEEIKQVFEQNKGAIFTRYIRARRINPQLQGKIVVELRIAPGGHVTNCHVVSSEMRARALDFERELLEFLKTLNFGAMEDVAPTIVAFPLDFLPA